MVSKSGGGNGKGIIDKMGLISCWSEGDRGLYYPFSFGPWGDFLVIGTGVCFYSCKFKWLIGKRDNVQSSPNWKTGSEFWSNTGVMTNELELIFFNTGLI